jgi:hypothetical protein
MAANAAASPSQQSRLSPLSRSRDAKGQPRLADVAEPLCDEKTPLGEEA